jgi:uncharacterized protein YdeI (BOF family)
MGYDELTIKPLAYQSYRGFWKVNGRCFFNKAECLRYASSIKNFAVTYHFFDEVYKSLDWNKEPVETLDQLYRLRAQQLRDKYKYLILCFSGGEDSLNILRTFIDNGIQLDEVVTYAPLKAIERLSATFDANNKDPENVIFEYTTSVVPVFESLSKTNPEIKLTVLDMTEKGKDFVMESQLHSLTKGGYGPSIQYTGGEMLARRCDGMYDTCIIMGSDKPRIIYDPVLNKFAQVFHDLAGQITDFNDEWHPRKTMSEGFYYSPDMPQITVKQSIVIKRNLEVIAKKLTDPRYEKLIWHKDATGTIQVNVHDTYIERMIYPSLDFPVWQADKITSFFYMESGNWLFKSDLFDSKKLMDFYQGQLHEFLHGIDSKFIRYANGHPTYFTMYHTAPNWL